MTRTGRVNRQPGSQDRLIQDMQHRGGANIRIIGDNFSEDQEVQARSASEYHHLWKSFRVHALLKEKLVDEFWLFINPVMPGEDIPLFTGVTERMPLRFITGKVFSSGVTALPYQAG